MPPRRSAKLTRAQRGAGAMDLGQACSEERITLLRPRQWWHTHAGLLGDRIHPRRPETTTHRSAQPKTLMTHGSCSLARGHRLLARNSTRTNPPDAIWKGRGRRSCRYTSSSTAPPGTPFTCTTRPASGSRWTCRVTATTRARYDLTEPRPVEPRRRGAPVPGRGAALRHAEAAASSPAGATAFGFE